MKTNNFNKSNGCITILIIVIALALIQSLFSGGSNKDVRSAACLISRYYVKERLLSPGTSEFGYCSSSKVTDLGGNRYEVNNHVDAKNQYNAVLRKNYSVTLKFIGNGSTSDINNWQLEYIYVE